MEDFSVGQRLWYPWDDCSARQEYSSEDGEEVFLGGDTIVGGKGFLGCFTDMAGNGRPRV